MARGYPQTKIPFELAYDTSGDVGVVAKDTPDHATAAKGIHNNNSDRYLKRE